MFEEQNLDHLHRVLHQSLLEQTAGRIWVEAINEKDATFVLAAQYAYYEPVTTHQRRKHLTVLHDVFSIPYQHDPSTGAFICEPPAIAVLRTAVQQAGTKQHN